MQSRYSEWAGPLVEIGRFEWERIIKKCAFNQMSTKLVALLLATYASEDGSRIYPGRERLAAGAGISTKQVSRALVKLEELGLVFKLHNGSSIGKRGLASVYRLTAPEKLFDQYQEDREELVQLVHEAAYTFHTAKNLGTPMSHGSSDLGTPVSPASSPDQGTYGADLGTFETDQGTYETHQGTPMSPHHVSLTKDLPPSNFHQSNFAAASPSVTRARPSMDNGSFTGPAMEDERRRQMEALQKLIDGEKAS